MSDFFYQDKAPNPEFGRANRAAGAMRILVTKYW